VKLRLLPLLACAALPACVTTPPVAPNVKVDTEVTGQCTKHCQSLGMELSAVVIIMNATGCVCEPALGAQGRAPSRAVAPGPSAAVGGAAVQAVLAAQQQSQQQQHQQQTEGWHPGATPGNSYHSPGASH
jgi:hypothetical protein